MFQTLIDPAFLAGEGGGTPALDLFFSATKALDSRITFTRASTGTFINSAGLVESASSGTARFTHDPVTLRSLGLLVEESRTNFLRYSANFSDGAWSKTAVSISSDSTIAPDGTASSPIIIEDSTNNAHRVFQSISSGSTTNAHSIFAKAKERSWIYFSSDDAGGTRRFVWFNVSTGTVGTVQTGWSDVKITAYANGWYKCEATITDNDGSLLVIFGASTADNISTYTGDGASGVYLWGAQLEAGAFSTSYIPTTSASATRSADVATITGANFSSWYNASEGTIAIEASASNASAATAFTIDDNSINNRIYLQYESTRVCRGSIVTSGSTVVNLAQSSTTSIKAAFAIKANDFAFSVSGSSASIDTTGAIPSPDRMRLGAAPVNGFGLYGAISRIRYYRRRLPDASLQTLTT